LTCGPGLRDACVRGGGGGHGQCALSVMEVGRSSASYAARAVTHPHPSSQLQAMPVAPRCPIPVEGRRWSVAQLRSSRHTSTQHTHTAAQRRPQRHLPLAPRCVTPSPPSTSSIKTSPSPSTLPAHQRAGDGHARVATAQLHCVHQRCCGGVRGGWHT